MNVKGLKMKTHAPVLERFTPGMEKALRKIVRRTIKAKIKRDGRPFILGHWVTNRCMCKCPSCLWRNNDWGDVPFEVLKNFYSEAKKEGFLAVGISGGEPFLRKDLGKLVKFIKEELGMYILIINTGWFLKKRMDEILPYIDMMIVSLDSAKPERHDEIRGLPNLYNTLIEGIELAKEKYPNVSYQFNCCIQKGVKEEIDELLKLSEKMKIKISFDVITEARNGGNGTNFTETNVGLPLEELKEICQYLLKKKQEGAPIVNSERYFAYFANGKPGYTCHFQKLVMCVDGRGNVEDCLNLNQPIANIKDMKLNEIMNLQRFKELRTAAEKCSSCNSPTMVDISQVWQKPQLVFQRKGIQVG